MDGQSTGGVSCFIDRNRACTNQCTAYTQDDSCQILSDLRTVATSARKVAAAFTDLSRLLRSRPVPKP